MTDNVSGTTSGNITGTVTGTASTASSSSSSSSSFDAGMGKDTFLKLLVAQLKYQNPLSPTDSEQYMAQMAQFTQVEKLADIQKSQSDLATWQRTVAGQGMIGKNITATLSSGTGQVTGRVTGLKLTDAGPRLVLENGTTVSVDEVTDVAEGSSSTSGSSASSPSTSSGSTASGTSTGTSTSTGTGTGTGTGTSTTGTSTGTGTGTGTTGTGSG